MRVNSVFDNLLAVFFYLTFCCIVLRFGDPLFIGMWYYALIPLLALSLGAAFRPFPLFQTGAALALVSTFAGYGCMNWFSVQPEGLLGLPHLFSLPGAAVGLSLAAARLRAHGSSSSARAFTHGFLGTLGGFLCFQIGFFVFCWGR